MLAFRARHSIPLNDVFDVLLLEQALLGNLEFLVTVHFSFTCTIRASAATAEAAANVLQYSYPEIRAEIEFEILASLDSISEYFSRRTLIRIYDFASSVEINVLLAVKFLEHGSILHELLVA